MFLYLNQVDDSLEHDLQMTPENSDDEADNDTSASRHRKANKSGMHKLNK